MKAYVLIGALALLPAVGLAQDASEWRESSFVKTTAGAWTGRRLADGQPDVQGHWSNTIGNHNNLSDPRGDGRAPSRVSDPPDGQVPFQPWARAKQQEFAAHLNNPTRPEYVEPFARCAPGGPTKSFMWHGYEIRQYRGYVVFLFDSGNRVIHLDRKPHLATNIKLWNGDSRGRWDGNTLVVDVTNNNAKARLGRSGEFVSEHVHIQERFIFDRSGERFTYEATYTDPTVLTRPFIITIPNRRVTEETVQDDWNNLTFRARHAGTELILEAYERICVEGNESHGGVAVPSN